MEHYSKSPEITADLAKKLISENRETNLFGLIGDLGSGKSAFVKGVARALGIENNVTSPTFVIMKCYSGKKRKLIHIDAYRLENLNDLQAIGFDELVSNQKNLIFIEWPEKVFEQFPPGMKIVKFEYLDENERKITF